MRAWKLITASGSPASHKVRALLRWANLPVRESVASALVLKSEVRPRLGGVRVPVLISPSNEALSDTRLIAQWLEGHEPGPDLSPRKAHHVFAMRLIEAFGDEILAPAAVSLRWHRASEEASAELGASVYPDFEPDRQARYARMLGSQLQASLERRGFGEAGIDEARALVEDTLEALDRHFDEYRFVFGRQPTLADFSLYGALSLLRTERDGADLVKDRPGVRRWLAETHAPFERREPGFVENDELPPTLIALVSLAAEGFIPEALQTCSVLGDWAECHPGKMNLPARLRVNDAPRPAEMRAETQWVFQHVLEPLREKHDASEGEALNSLLNAIGFEKLADYDPPRKVVQEHHSFSLDMKVPAPSSKERESAAAVAEALIRAREDAGATRHLDRMILS